MEKKNKSIKRELKFWAGVWFAQILLFYIFSKISSAVRFFESFYEWKKDFFGFVFSKLGFSAQNQGLLNDFFSTANDLFLKSNQQEGSVTYSYFIDLLVRYERG